jgi:hypothetical protein
MTLGVPPARLVLYDVGTTAKSMLLLLLTL